MDDARFDGVTRASASSQTRRRTLLRVGVDTTGPICFCNSQICMRATCDGES